MLFRSETTAPGGHGSLPGPDNPIYRLSKALGRIEAHQFPVMTTATTRAYFKALAEGESGPTRDDLRAVAASPPDPAAAARLSESVFLNALLWIAKVEVPEGGVVSSVNPEALKANLDPK